MNGTLYIVATPIGNLEDITLRAVRILGEVHTIAAEDTRHTRKLLSHLGIQKPLLSLHAHNEAARTTMVEALLQGGHNLALVSDAGTPGLCDPGAQIVAAMRERGFDCVPIPGPSALAAALSVSALTHSRFFFQGFLPARGAERTRHLATLAALDVPIFLYEAPHRLHKTLAALHHALGDRQVTVFRELTKRFEEVFDIVLSQDPEQLQARGEYVLLVHPAAVCAQADDDVILDHLCALIQQGIGAKDAVAQTAADLNVKKNRVYQLHIDNK